MTNPKARSFIHYDPDRVDYAVNKEELNNIKNAGSNYWKDFGIGCLAVGIPCAINAVPQLLGKPFQVTPWLFLNSLFGCVGIVLGFVFLIIWFRTKTSLDQIIKTIENKPKILFTPEVTAVGQIEQDSAE